jgi:hypothetical protein
MIPINVPADKAQLLASSIACQVGTMPLPTLDYLLVLPGLLLLNLCQF